MLTNVNTKQIVNGPITNKNVQITDFLFVDREQVCVIKTAPDPITGDKVDVPLTYGTDYEITKYIPDGVALTEMALTASTGTCLLKDTVDVANGESITMYRKSALIQDKEYPRTGPFPSATHEGALDFLTMQNQEQTEQINRCAKVPITVANFSGDLPYPNPGKALIINAEGTGLTLSEDNYIDQAVDSAANALIATQQASISSAQASLASTSAANAALSELNAANLLTQVGLAETDALNAILAQEVISNNNLIVTGDAKILLATQQATNAANSAIQAETAASALEGVIPASGDEGKFLMCNATSYTNGVSYQEVLGGIVKFNPLGSTSSNQTLNKNEITTAAFTGTPTVSLPTVTDTAKQVGCILDFTTSSTGYPVLNKYATLTGTIAVTNGNATITGTGTAFSTELQVGDLISIASVEYKVSAIASNTSLTLSVVYAGTTASGLTTYRNFFRWGSRNGGKAPTAYSNSTGVRNKLVFKSIWENSLLYWEVEYDTHGGFKVAFASPNISADGSFGGSTYAVRASNYQAGYEPYKASDGNAATAWDTSSTTPGQYYDMYNPDPVEVDQYNLQNYASGGYATTAGTTYYSDDGNNWVQETTFTNSTTGASGTWSIPVPSANRSFHKYRRVYSSANSSSSNTIFAECKMAGWTLAT